MKTLRITHSSALVISLALMAAIPGRAQAQAPGQFGGAPLSLQLATSESNAFWLGQQVGKPLRGSSGEELGTISDFLIEPQTGRVRFAVVPSGAGEGGETYRLVPMAALEHSGHADGLTARIGKAQWDRVGTMTTPQLSSRVTLNDEQHQRLAQQFALANLPAQETAAGELLRATALKERAVRSNNEQVGTIETVAIDVPRRTASAVVKSAGGFTGGEQRFLVPFTQLQWTGDVNAGATTTLTRNDFQQAQAAISPTGFTGAPFTRGTLPPHAAQSAAQQAVNQATGNANVQVAAETWIILRGTVDNEQKKAEIERAAQQAAPGLPIDNKVTVKGP